VDFVFQVIRKAHPLLLGYNQMFTLWATLLSIHRNLLPATA
jgi:hypothetical protein